MKHPERIEDYLEHIAQAIQRATEYVEHVRSLSAFQRSRRDQDAVIRNIEIIGEAARQSSSTRRNSWRRTRDYHGSKCGACATR